MAESGASPGPAQLHALFDILTHAETYREIEGFKHADAVAEYGYPFAQGDGSGFAPRSGSPLLQMLNRKFVMSLPPARALPLEFWNVRVQGIIAGFADAELSESYDKGAVGTRKNLATASSAFIEAAARGCLGGCSPSSSGHAFSGGLAGRTYDVEDARDLARSWDDVVREMVYGRLLDELFDHATKTADIEAHSPAIVAAVDCIIIQLAGFMHQICVVSADGPYIIKLLESAHRLVPYSLVRQTLRVSNAATMMAAMMRLLLAKLGVGGMTNWIGLTKNADEGMNLLQRIISAVLAWDRSDFRRAAEQTEKKGSGRLREHFAAIRQHMARFRQEHEQVRRQSVEGQRSIIAAIFDSVNADLAKDLSESDHAECGNYYSALLSVRDREQITAVLCRQSPDLVTQALREVTAALEPLIRQLHDKIDLTEHLSDAENFIGEFIVVVKGSGQATNETTPPPTAANFVHLLRRNRHLLYKWLHKVASQTPEIRDMFRNWAVEAIKEFRNPAISTDIGRGSSGSSAHASVGAGAMDEKLRRLFNDLSGETRLAILPILDAHAAHLAALEEASTRQVQDVVNEGNRKCQPQQEPQHEEGLSNGMSKPVVQSAFVARWQALIDETLISPETADGPVRRGRDVRGTVTQGKTGGRRPGRGDRETEAAPGPGTAEPEDESGPLEVPDARLVVEAMGSSFRDLLLEPEE